MVAGLLRHRLAHAHPHRTLHLAFDCQTVQGLTAIVCHPHFVDRHLTGLLVYGHLDDLSRVAVAHGAADGRSTVLLAAVGLRNGGVGAGYGDRAAIIECLHHDLLEGEALVLSAGSIELAQTLDVAWRCVQPACRGSHEQTLELIGRIDGGIAHDERDT